MRTIVLLLFIVFSCKEDIDRQCVSTTEDTSSVKEDTSSETKPKPVPPPPKKKEDPPPSDYQWPAIRQIVTNKNYNCILSVSGQVKCWGDGEYYQLGYPTNDDIGDNPGEMGKNLRPVNLGTDRTAKAISVGGNHTCAILNDDTVICWGLGGQGKLGQDNTKPIGDEEGEIAALTPINLGTGRTAKAISNGRTHTCAILDNDFVKCWGSGEYGKLGQGNTDDLGDNQGEMGSLSTIRLGSGGMVKAISAGANHTCAILSNDRVKCWGSGESGKLGQGNTDDIGDDENEIRDLPSVSLGTGRTAKAISSGLNHTCAILDNDTVKCWGRGFDGQLGYDDRKNRGTRSGQMGNNLPKVNLGANRTAKVISAGSRHTCAILDNDTAKCWGEGDYGKLGTGSNDNIGDQRNEMSNLNALSVSRARKFKAITAGESHTCAVAGNNSIKCWGYGLNGQLGQGDTYNIGDQPGEMDSIKAIRLGLSSSFNATAAEESHTCALLDNDTVKCMGFNGQGQLGSRAGYCGLNFVGKNSVFDNC